MSRRYFVQLILKLDVRDITPQLKSTKKCIGLDMGLRYLYADSDNNVVEPPKYYRKAEKRLNKLNRRKSKKFRKRVRNSEETSECKTHSRQGKKRCDPGDLQSPSCSAPRQQSNNYIKARKKYAKGHLKVSRQREEFAKRLALRLIQSNDLIAYEDLKVKNLVRNKKLAKSINDAGWSQLRKWIEYFGVKYGRLTVAVNPAYTSQKCFNCGKLIKKSLSVRTHVCSCGYIEDRDTMAALNILKKGTIGHIGTYSEELNAWGDLSSILVGRKTCQDNLSQ